MRTHESLKENKVMWCIYFIVVLPFSWFLAWLFVLLNRYSISGKDRYFSVWKGVGPLDSETPLPLKPSPDKIFVPLMWQEIKTESSSSTPLMGPPCSLLVLSPQEPPFQPYWAFQTDWFPGHILRFRFNWSQDWARHQDFFKAPSGDSNMVLGLRPLF